ncbi:DNA cytosine methyltransferase [Pseudomonas sp. 2hn]|nr:DNA cytosine methyltransferase [Pseudomonas sp. 2hn]
MDTEAPHDERFSANNQNAPCQRLLPLSTDDPGQEPMKKIEHFPLPPDLSQPLCFADLFAGCGGLSLGLSLAGLNGVFAVERDQMAFKTLSTNLIDRKDVPITPFAWPSWLEKQAWGIDDIIDKHGTELASLRGKVQVLAGGPPCQGFSFAGKRQEADPRNKLFEKYVEMVRAIQPAALVLENVPGMKVAHTTKGRKLIEEISKGRGLQLKPQSYYDKLVESLNQIGYEVLGRIVDSSRFGVPQKRPRLIVIGLRRDLAHHLQGGMPRAFDLLEEARLKQLQELDLPDQVAAVDAISDLEMKGRGTRPCSDEDSPKGFDEIRYTGPKTHFQHLMHQNCFGDVDSLRLARHRAEIKDRFQAIIDDTECAKGVRMNVAQREKYGLKKHRIYPMQASAPAPTITTLPDDVLHYSEPRILTVRESARLQSFPDWFRFRGKFTTGGSQRTKECPRYTQVGNAVPPYLARAIGMAIQTMLQETVLLAKAHTDLKQEEKMMAIA